MSRPQPLVRRLGLTANRCPSTDLRRLDLAIFGVPIFGGLLLASRNFFCAADADAVFAAAIRDKRNTHRDLVDSNRCEFLVLAAGTGGRWHKKLHPLGSCTRALPRCVRTGDPSPIYAARVLASLVESPLSGLA